MKRNEFIKALGLIVGATAASSIVKEINDNTEADKIEEKDYSDKELVDIMKELIKEDEDGNYYIEIKYEDLS